jgi:putative Mg2+ transporter-C (MgtC) family protein
MIESPDTWQGTLARIAVAAALAGLIGLERERRGRDAGLRTNMLVAIGSAVFILIALEMAENLRELDGVRLDPTRVVSGLVGGILGAGAIIQSRGEVHGLTTAAGIWVCAAIGAASGFGLYTLAGLTAAAALVVLVLLRIAERYLPTRSREG